MDAENSGVLFSTDHSPFEDVLIDVGRLWGVPLNGMRVWLVAGFCYDHLDRAVTTCVEGTIERVKRKLRPPCRVCRERIIKVELVGCFVI